MTFVFVTDRKQHHIIFQIVFFIRQKEKVYLTKYQNIFHVLKLLQKAKSWKQFFLASTCQTLSLTNEIYLLPLQFKTTLFKQNVFSLPHLPPQYPIMPLHHFFCCCCSVSLPGFLRCLAVWWLETCFVQHSKVIILYLYCIG